MKAVVPFKSTHPSHVQVLLRAIATLPSECAGLAQGQIEETAPMLLDKGAALNLVASLVPPSLRSLIPLVEKWGFTRPSDQDRFVELMQAHRPDEVEAFNRSIDSARSDIRTWRESLTQFDKQVQEIEEDDWKHPYWDFLACLKVRDLTGRVLTPEEEDEVRQRGVLEGRRILLGNALLKADALFSAKDYAGYVATLSPFADLLTHVQNMKLEFATRRVSQE